MSWRREAKGGVPSLRQERKALAERYTIDADDAERRTQLAEEEAAVLSAERATPAPAAPTARNEAEPEIAPVEPEADNAEAPEMQSADLPIYRWFSNS